FMVLFEGDGARTGAGVLLASGAVSLANLTLRPPDIRPLDGSPQQQRHVRLRLSHGLLQMKSWRVGAAEPKAWQSGGLAAGDSRQPTTVFLKERHEGGVVVRSLAVRAVLRWVPSPKQAEQLAQAAALRREGMQLSGQRQFDAALEKLRAAVALEQQA